MQHIFNIAINMDDETIKRQVAEKAEKEIMANLQREVGRVIFARNSYAHNGYDERHLSDWAKRQFDDFLANNKNEIIAGAAKELADRLARSKAGKAILDNLKV